METTEREIKEFTESVSRRNLRDFSEFVRDVKNSGNIEIPESVDIYLEKTLEELRADEIDALLDLEKFTG